MDLEEAFLETVYVSHKYELLNCDDHQGVLKKNKIDISVARPDITHQVCGH
jgi:rRNA small subunit pseudouridine methyltransferase Nep1